MTIKEAFSSKSDATKGNFYRTQEKKKHHPLKRAALTKNLDMQKGDTVGPSDNLEYEGRKSILQGKKLTTRKRLRGHVDGRTPFSVPGNKPGRKTTPLQLKYNGSKGSKQNLKKDSSKEAKTPFKEEIRTRKAVPVRSR